MSLPPLRAGDKTAGQDVSLEYRWHARSSWSGSARHLTATAFLLHVKLPPLDISAAPSGLPNVSRPHSKLCTRSSFLRVQNFPLNTVVMVSSRTNQGGDMKYLELLELMLNCLRTAMDLWDWLQQNNFFFEAFGLLLS